MLRRSLRTALRCMGGLVVVLLLLGGVLYRYNAVMRRQDAAYTSFVEVADHFHTLLIQQQDVLSGSLPLSRWRQHLSQLAFQCERCHPSGQRRLLAGWIDTVRGLTNSRDAIDSLREETSRRLTELTRSVRYIHEHHLTTLKNFMAHGEDRELEGRIDFSLQGKSPSRSAPEPDIIAQAVSIQHALVDILNDFYQINDKADFAALEAQFHAHLRQFYDSTKRFESFSLDAQDGLLVEELLDSGRTLERQFGLLLDKYRHRKQMLRAMEEEQQDMARRLDQVRQVLLDNRNQSRQRVFLVNRGILFIELLVVGLLILHFSGILRALQRLDWELEQVGRDLLYRIPEQAFDMLEFRRLAKTFNAMSATLAKHLRSLREEVEAREQAQQRLAKAKKEWERTFDAVPDAVLLLDRNMRILRANSALSRWLGRPFAEIIGRSCHEVVHGLPAPPDYCPFSQMAHDKAPQHWERQEAHLDRWLEADLVPLLDDEGELQGGVLVLRDTSAERRAEQQRAALEERLGRMARMEAVGLMASGVAHDLNNILSGIINYPELLLLELPPDDPKRPMLEEIRRSGLRAAAVVSDLLTVARGAATVKEPVSLNQIVEEFLQTAEWQRTLAEAPGVRLETRLDESLATCLGSATHLQKVVMNLLFNAVEAMPDGGVVTVRTRNVERDGKPWVVLEVEDTGEGIAEDDLAHIFEPFYSKKKLGRSGTGLGLAVVWNTVQDHGGKVEVRSSRQGATFTVCLPARDTAPEMEADAADTDGGAGRTGTILVVDDEPLQRDLAKKMLSLFGHQVHCVASGEEAVAYLREHDCDLVLLDMIMGSGINGRETLERILAFKPDQKAVIVSGYAEDAEVARAIELGAAGLLKKPYSLAALRHTVDELLDTVS